MEATVITTKAGRTSAELMAELEKFCELLSAPKTLEKSKKIVEAFSKQLASEIKLLSDEKNDFKTDSTSLNDDIIKYAERARGLLNMPFEKAREIYLADKKTEDDDYFFTHGEEWDGYKKEPYSIQCDGNGTISSHIFSELVEICEAMDREVIRLNDEICALRREKEKA